MALWAIDKDGNKVKAAGIGVPGPAGKTAYQYAVDGGFSGTEEEFSALLAKCSNPSLLDNSRWDRKENIINQRNVSGTIAAPGYFIDRWKLVSGSVTITEDGLVLNGTMAQILEADPGQEVTASYLTDGNVLPAEYDSETRTFSITAEGTLIRAAKLELGAQQTLAHQDEDGNWVLNDPPPDKALELAKCQRHQFVFGSSEAGSSDCILGYAISTTDAVFILNFPITMRAKPTMAAIQPTWAWSIYSLNSGSIWPHQYGSIFSLIRVSPQTAYVQVTVNTDRFQKGEVLVLRANETTDTGATTKRYIGQLIFDSNL